MTSPGIFPVFCHPPQWFLDALVSWSWPSQSCLAVWVCFYNNKKHFLCSVVFCKYIVQGGMWNETGAHAILLICHMATIERIFSWNNISMFEVIPQLICPINYWMSFNTEVKFNVYYFHIVESLHVWSLKLFCFFLSLQIRVNAVNPTVVLTDMGKKAWSDETVVRAVKQRIPLGRFAGIHITYQKH